MLQYLKLSAGGSYLVSQTEPDGTGTPAIAVWAYPDSATVTGTINVGVVAYHSSGIAYVKFDTDGGTPLRIWAETINPDTNEYEFVYKVDTTSLSNGSHTINAKAYPYEGSSKALDGLIIQVANGVSYASWYVDSVSGSDVAPGDGSFAHPYATVAKAASMSSGGDTVYLRTGSYIFPSSSSTRTKYVTFTPYSNEVSTVDITSQVIYGKYIKCVGLTFTSTSFTLGSSLQTSTMATVHHIWFNNCTFQGYPDAYIWPANAAYAFFGPSVSYNTDLVFEDCDFRDWGTGIQTGGYGPTIIRGCSTDRVYAQPYRSQNNDTFITNCTAANSGEAWRSKAWSVASIDGPYNFGAGQTLNIYLTTNASAYVLKDSISLVGVLSSADIVSTLNLSVGFAAQFTASLSASPYPHVGNVKIEHNSNIENHYFYVDGTAQTTLGFVENALAANLISVTYPAKNGAQHFDVFANAGSSISNWIIRNCSFYNVGSFGLKCAAQTLGTTQTKENIAIINNIMHCLGSTTLYNQTDASNHGIFNNWLIEFNTLWDKPGGVGTPVNNPISFVITAATVSYSSFIFRNNIVGDNAITNFASYPAFMDFSYNLHNTAPVYGDYSIQGDPKFTDTSTPVLSLQFDSPAIGLASTSSKIKYDNQWHTRDASPDAGALEYIP